MAWPVIDANKKIVGECENWHVDQWREGFEVVEKKPTWQYEVMSIFLKNIVLLPETTEQLRNGYDLVVFFKNASILVEGDEDFYWPDYLPDTENQVLHHKISEDMTIIHELLLVAIKRIAKHIDYETIIQKEYESAIKNLPKWQTP